MDAYVKDEFPHRVELNKSIRDQADLWLRVNLPDTGDNGDISGWLWDRSAITPTGTHIYSFRHEHDATQFALTWS